MIVMNRINTLNAEHIRIPGCSCYFTKAKTPEVKLFLILRKILKSDITDSQALRESLAVLKLIHTLTLSLTNTHTLIIS